MYIPWMGGLIRAVGITRKPPEGGFVPFRRSYSGKYDLSYPNRHDLSTTHPCSTFACPQHHPIIPHRVMELDR